MLKLSRLIVALMALVSVLAFQPLAVVAQQAAEPSALKNVTLWVYPEFDDPRVLVMIEGKAVGATLPAPIRFLVPQSAEMYSAGSKDAGGVYSGGPPDRKASQIEGWDEISYQLKYETFRVEFYYPGITGQPDKQIAFDYHWLYSVADLRVVVQQPLKATAFSVAPPGQAGTEDQFKVVTYSSANLSASQITHFDIQYNKADSVPSVSGSSPLPTAGSGSSNTWVIWVIVIAVVVVGGILVIYLARSKGNARPSRPTKRPEGRKAPQPAAEKGRRNKFCNYCGKPMGENANFCGECGKKVAK